MICFSISCSSILGNADLKYNLADYSVKHNKDKILPPIKFSETFGQRQQ